MNMIRVLHERCSRTALYEFGFSRQSRSCIAQASAWPDRFRWYHDAPHAQTPPPQSPADAQRAAQACATLLRTYLRDIAEAPLPAAAVIWLGFALHLVQDLAAHEGRSKNEHALQVFLFWQNPDYQPRAYRGALAYSRLLLRFLQCTLPAERWQALQKNVQPLSHDALLRLLGDTDFRFLSLLSFGLDGVRYMFDRSPHKRVRWNPETVLGVLRWQR